MSETLKQSSNSYLQYADKIGVSKKLLKLIENQEYFEHLVFKTSLYLFFGSAAYIFLKRFYLIELLGAFISIIWAILTNLVFIGKNLNWHGLYKVVENQDNLPSLINYEI